jgi:hypothetical protein
MLTKNKRTLSNEYIFVKKKDTFLLSYCFFIHVTQATSIFFFIMPLRTYFTLPFQTLFYRSTTASQAEHIQTNVVNNGKHVQFTGEKKLKPIQIKWFIVLLST